MDNTYFHLFMLSLQGIKIEDIIDLFPSYSDGNISISRRGVYYFPDVKEFSDYGYCIETDLYKMPEFMSHFLGNLQLYDEIYWIKKGKHSVIIALPSYENESENGVRIEFEIFVLVEYEKQNFIAYSQFETPQNTFKRLEQNLMYEMTIK